MLDDSQIDNSSDVSVPETPATIGTETTETVEAVETEKLSATDATSEVDEETAQLDEEINKQLAEKPEDVDDLKFFRTLVRNKEKEVRALKNQKPEYSESDRLAIDFYNDLTAFDVEQGVPSSKKFAERLVQKDKDLAIQAAWDLLSQPVDDSGYTVGHKALEKMGLDPMRLDELRKFSRGELKGDHFGIVAVPEFVPPELTDAYKAMSQPLREDLDWRLESDDPLQKQAAIEALQDKQAKLEYMQSKEKSERESTMRTQAEIEQSVNRDVIETFNTFTESFQETPTYTAATVSGNPAFDGAVKEIVSMAILNLNEPESVTGKQALRFFNSLGLTLDAKEVSTVVDSVIGNIEAAVKAEKGNYQTAKTDALDRKQQALSRATGVRNRIFVEAMNKLAGKLKDVSEQNGDALEKNGGMPAITGSGSSMSNGQQKLSTLEIIKQMAAK